MDTSQNMAIGLEHALTEGARRATGVSACSSGGAAATSAILPEPEVREKQAYRRLTAEYKLRILREADACGPGETGALLRRRGDYDSEIIDDIVADICSLSDTEFIDVVRTFRHAGAAFGSDEEASASTYDCTGLGWLYKKLKGAGEDEKIELLFNNSRGYFDQLDILRDEFGIDLDLYKIGEFSEPLTASELEYIAEYLKLLPEEKLDTIGGITILDRRCNGGKLGAHDSFGNVILYRKYAGELLKQPLRIDGVPFVEELTLIRQKIHSRTIKRWRMTFIRHQRVYVGGVPIAAGGP